MVYYTPGKHYNHYTTDVYSILKYDFNQTEKNIYLCPNINVDLVSDSLKEAGEQQITMVVLALPPKLSCRILVSLLSL